MQQIPIAAVPNQSLSFQADGNQYDINIRTCGDDTIVPGSSVMAFDIYINNVAIVTGARATSGIPNYQTGNNGEQQLVSSGYFLIPYPYLSNGNFAVLCQNYDYPNWQQFGITQYLVYISQAELEAIINGTGT